jgi:hypothetical protein
MPIPTKKKGEGDEDFLKRCMSDEKMKSEYTDDKQRFAVCAAQISLAADPLIVSFDFDDTLATEKGYNKAVDWIAKGATIYILTARCKDGNNLDLINRAKALKIPLTKVIFTCHQDKYKFIDKYSIDVHYDNNKEQVDKINQNTDAKAILFK